LRIKPYLVGFKLVAMTWNCPKKIFSIHVICMYKDKCINVVYGWNFVLNFGWKFIRKVFGRKSFVKWIPGVGSCRAPSRPGGRSRSAGTSRRTGPRRRTSGWRSRRGRTGPRQSAASRRPCWTAGPGINVMVL
jgi:hypothetical protein